MFIIDLCEMGEIGEKIEINLENVTVHAPGEKSLQRGSRHALGGFKR